MKMNINEVFSRIKWLVIPYLLILCICLIIKLTFSREEIYFTINSFYGPFYDWIAPYVTDLGDGLTAIAIAAIMSLFNYRKGFIVFTAYAVSSISAQILKYLFDAPRPKLYFQDQVARMRFVKGVDILSLHSFPSGHTVTAFSLAVVFTYWSKNKAWGPVFLLLAILIGYSRMYLSEHFFEDVVGGSVIGVIVTIFWLFWLDNRAFIKRPKWQRGLLN